MARKPTNMTKIYNVKQGKDAYLERLMAAFKQYPPYNPESEESQQALILGYANQAAPDIKRKLQSLERLGE